MRPWDATDPAAAERTMPEWAPGDTVWYGTTLYDVADITHDKVILRRHEPLTIRLHPATRCEMLPSVD